MNWMIYSCGLYLCAVMIISHGDVNTNRDTVCHTMSSISWDNTGCNTWQWSPMREIATLLSCCVWVAGWMAWFSDADLLTHWGRVTHLCISKLNIIDSDDGLSPGWRQAIIWINARILLIGLLGTHLIEINTFSFKKMHLKMLSAK